MFGSIGTGELVVIFLIALMIFGPRKLPEIGQSLGRAINEFKKASSELRNRIEEEIQNEQPAAPPPATTQSAAPAAPDSAEEHVS